ncbi:expressed unknown protein [Seminavis robusta]|uniref:Uncharacterized protein n=1 Tax=Seminavis robusta TaxID=568900 RepID=A0A9N8H5X7_9STRA|nr:expressed unknown protein [Seminavis robusta]|eukprot:Sro127_g060980.1 n/a (207) ;mRNA; r:97659-98279
MGNFIATLQAGIECALMFGCYVNVILLLLVTTPEAGYFNQPPLPCGVFLLFVLVLTAAFYVWTSEIMRSAEQPRKLRIEKASKEIAPKVDELNRPLTLTQVGNDFNDTLNKIGNGFIAGIECALILGCHFSFFAMILLLCVATPEAGYLNRELFLLSFVVATVACCVWTSKIMRSARQSRKATRRVITSTFTKGACVLAHQKTTGS